MESRDLPIIIAGGGIGGMTVALALSQKGYSTIVMEQAANLRIAGAGIQLGPNVFKMFEALGISKEMNKVALFPDNIYVKDGISGKELLQFPLGKEIIRRFKYPYGVFHREVLLQTLLNECQKTSLITFITSARVIDYYEEKDKVIVKTEKGKSFEGAALIDAEGLWSIIRNKIEEGSPPKNTGDVAFRGLISRDQMPEMVRTNDVFLWSMPSAHFVHYPIQNNQYNLIVAVNNKKLSEKKTLDDLFSGCCSEIIALLNCIDKDQKWELFDRVPASVWAKGRVVLLGDAAHPTLPYLAQGAGLTIEDAVVLANKVHEFKDDFPSAFQAFQQERYLRTSRVQLTAHFIGEIHHASGIAREVRNSILTDRSYEENYEMFAWLWNGINLSSIR